MNRSRMSSMLATPLPAMPKNACTADHTMAAPMANSAREWKPSTSSVPTTAESRFMRWWSESVCCNVMPVLPSQVELVETLVRAAIIGGQRTVGREVLVAHMPESLPLVIVAHLPVGVPGIEPQAALAPLHSQALRPAQDLRADAEAGVAPCDRELVHVELVAALFAPDQGVRFHQRDRAAHAIAAARDIHPPRLDVRRNARGIELAPCIDALLRMPAARLAQQAHHGVEIGARISQMRRGDRDLHQS